MLGGAELEHCFAIIFPSSKILVCLVELLGYMISRFVGNFC